MAIETPSAAFATPSNNGTVTYTYPFNNSKFEDDDVFVYLYNTTTGDYDVQTVTDDYAISGNTITFTEAPTTQVLILRRTDFNALKIPNFTPGSSIRGQDLDSNFTQLLRVNQEFRDLKVDKFFPEVRADLDMNSQRISDLADASTDTDAVTRGQLAKVITDDLIAGDCITLTDAVGGTNSGDQVTVGITDGSITSAKITDGTIVNADINDNADINGSKLADGTVTSAKITDGTIVNADISTSADIDGSKLLDNSIDVSKVKGIDKAEESEYDSTWAGDDDQIATVGALSKRYDVEIGTSEPTNDQPGKLWLNSTTDVNSLNMWNGSTWQVLTSGTPYIPQGTTIVRYVDAVNGSDDSTRSGFLPQSPLKTIKRALTLINDSDSGDGTLVVVEPGVYQEALPLTIEKNNVSVVGKSMRSCFIHPTVATENNNMWEVDSGTYIANFTLLGLKVPTDDQGSRNNTIDNDSTYGLPSNQPFAVTFRSGDPVILKSPYIQNCSHFADAHFDNEDFDPNTFPSTDSETYSAVAGDETSAPTGGGLLVDGSAVSSSSPIRSMVVDSFTQICLDGPGILVTNNGYAQLVSFFGTFCHYHAKAKNGGQINLSNCVSDFGTYGLIADGKSPTAIATATASAANSGATSVTIGAITTANTFHGTVSRPLDHMMITIDSVDYGVVSSTANGSGWDIELASALTSNISNTTVSFALRSYISTGGHTFEYVGVGTDYSNHPDQGGVAIEANQVTELNGGKVWQSSTDHIGKFKAGSTLVVDQVADTVELSATTVTGNITVTGTVDGRDVATDGTKLDGIATGATAYGNSDVDAHLNQSTASSGEILSYDGSDYEWISAAAGYSDSNVDTHLNQSTASSGEVLSWDGSDYDWVAQSTGGLTNNSSQNNSTGVGDSALDNDSGNHNTAFGADAMTAAVSGIQNTAVGAGALTALTEGEYNTAAGNSAGGSITTGNRNTSIGAYSGNLGTTANDGTNVGYGAGSRFTSNGITAIGSYALHGSVGDSTGANNTAVGSYSSYSVTSGANNVSIGNQSLRLLTTGSQNVAIGDECLKAATTASANIAMGKEALVSVTTGGHNCVIGTSAGDAITDGEKNVSLGNYSLGAATGSENTALGYEAGANITSGSNNIVIGHDTSASSATVSDEITLGNSDINSLRIPGLQSGASDGQVLTFNSSNGNITLADIDVDSGVTNNSDQSESIGLGPNALDSETTGTENTALGSGAGTDLTTGVSNVFVGRSAGTNLTTGGSNVIIGHDTAEDMTTTNSCVIIGRMAGQNTTGDGQILIGSFAGKKQTGAEGNIVIGYEALSDATGTPTRVTCIGFESQYKSTTDADDNTTVGYRTLRYNTTGADNSAFGSNALLDNTTGSRLTAVGSDSLESNTTGDQNTAVGSDALQTNTTGSNNTSVGFSSLQSNTTGSSNTAVGKNALQSNTSADNNVAIGEDSLQDNTTGAGNVAIGYTALNKNTTASNNVAVGNNALKQNTTGAQNTACGADNLNSNTTGSHNTAFGYNPLDSNTTGSENTGIGAYSLKKNTTGSDNTAIGYKALEENTTGPDNTAVGSSVMLSNTTGSALTAIGSNALYANTDGDNNTACGYLSLRYNTTGGGNTAIGRQSLYDNTSGDFNTGLGHLAGENITTGGNNTCVGYGAEASSATVSNQITLGNSNVSSLRCNTQSISSLSDGRDKTEVEDLPLGLDFINTLRPVKFKWDTRDGNGKDGSYEAGFIAQDLKSAQSSSNADYLKMVMDENPERLEAAYGQLIPVLVQAIKDLKSEIETLKSNG